MNIISVSRRCPGLGPCRPGPSSALARACVVYVVKEVASFPGARLINGRGA